MKKIGILTLQSSHNCGSIMQAYALQEVLIKGGAAPEFIDFATSKQLEEYSVYTNQKGLKGIIKNLIFWWNRSVLTRHWNDYHDYRLKNLKLSENSYTEESDVSNIPEQYDAFITGSDQVWNVTIPDYNDIYFLSFKGKTKMAYAASFGARDPRKFVATEQIAQYLKDIDYLSIRENSGKKIVEELADRSIDVVLDPTLLIDEIEYEKARCNSGIPRGEKYIFYYATLHEPELDRFVKQIAKIYNIKVVSWNSKEYYKKFVWRHGFKLTEHQHPGIYLDLIKHAELVITTSFHGSVFSTIYKKKFWTLKNGDMYKADDRVITMIQNLGIESRLIEPKYDANFDYFQECDYSIYENNLQKLRNHSLEFLKKIFE